MLPSSDYIRQGNIGLTRMGFPVCKYQAMPISRTCAVAIPYVLKTIHLNVISTGTDQRKIGSGHIKEIVETVTAI